MKRKQLLALILALAMLLGLTQAAAEDPTGHTHRFVERHDLEATCESGGITSYTCADCGYSYEIQTPALGHSWYWESTTATCLGPGVDTYRCSRCGAERHERRGPLGHDYGERQTDIPATCTEAGRDVRVCSRDSTHVWYFDVEPLGHDWGEWTVITPATASAEGLERRVCRRDPAHVEERAIPPLTEGGEDLPLADISLTGDCDPGPYMPGQQVTATYTLTNTGDVSLTYRESDGDAAEVSLPETLAPGESFVFQVQRTVTEEDLERGFHVDPMTGEYAPETTYTYSAWCFSAGAAYVYDPGYGNPWYCRDEAVMHRAIEGQQEGPSLLLHGTAEPMRTEFHVAETVEFRMVLTNNGTEVLENVSLVYNEPGAAPEERFAGTLAPGERFITDYSYTFPPEMEGGTIPFQWQGFGYRAGSAPDGVPAAESTNPGLVRSNIEAVRYPVLGNEGPALYLTVEQTSEAKAAYAVNDNPIFKSVLTNVGSVTLEHCRVLFRDSEGFFRDGWLDVTLAPGESIETLGWNHWISDAMVAAGTLDYIWFAYGYEEGQYTPQADPDDPAEVPGMVLSNRVSLPIPMEETGSHPELILSNADGSGEGKGAGDWVTTTLTFEVAGDAALYIQSITVDQVNGAMPENFDFTEYSEHVDGFRYWVTEGDTFVLGIQVMPGDVADGQVVRHVYLYGNEREDMLPPYVKSNTVTVTIPLEGEPDPTPTEESPALDLMVSCSHPEPFWTDFNGETEDIAYDLLVVNSGSVPVRLTGISWETEGAPDLLDLSGLNVVLLPGDHWSGAIVHRYLDSQTTGDSVWISFTAVGESVLGPVESEPVRLTHPLGEQPPWSPEPTSLEVVKVESGHSLNLGGYVEGETVAYEVTVTNTCDTAIPLVSIHDDLPTVEGDTTLSDLQPHESRTVTYHYEVTAPDVDTGYVRNRVNAAWTCPVTGAELLDWDECIVDVTGTPDDVRYGLRIEKSLVEAVPAAGYFTENDMVTFYVLVENASGAELFDVTVTDPLTGDSVSWPVMPAGQIQDLYFVYTITAPDAQLGSVTNTAAVTGHDAYGNTYSRTDSVTIPTGIPPEPETPSLYVFKEETSDPEDERGYQLDEWITWAIRLTNDGQVDLRDVEVYDVTAEGVPFVGSVPLLPVGAHVTFSFSWQVTEDDLCAPRIVYNTALACYSAEGLTDVPVFSNTTESPTWSPDPVPPPPDRIPGEGESCIVTLAAAGRDSSTYELTLCGDHVDAAARTAGLLAAAGTPEEEAAAWNAAAGLWLEEIHEAYDALAAGRGAEARGIIQRDRAALDHLAASMALRPSDDPVRAARARAEWLMRQCAELCYLRGNAPAERPDSRIFGRIRPVTSLIIAGEEPACAVSVSMDGSPDVRIIERLCGDQAEAQAAVDVMLDRSLTRAQYADVFRRAQRLWRTRLDMVTNAAWNAAPEADRPALLTARRAFDSWFAARSATLELLYPDSPGAAAEVLTGILRLQVLMDCPE